MVYKLFIISSEILIFFLSTNSLIASLYPETTVATYSGFFILPSIFKDNTPASIILSKSSIVLKSLGLNK